MKELKVLFFLNSDVRGGVEEHVLSLLKALDRDIFTPVLVCPPALADKFGADLPRDVKLYRIGLSSWLDIRSIRALAGALRRESPDIVHLHMFNASMFGAAVAKLSGVPVTVETCHGPERWRTGWIKKSYLPDRFFKMFVDHFIAVSGAAGRHLEENKKVPPEKITVIRNGRDLDAYDAPAGPGGFALPDSRGKVMAGVVGRLDGQKGHRFLIEAVPAIVERFKDIIFVFVGDGALRRELEAQASKLGVAGYIHFAGHHREVPWFLRQIDIFVLPSLYEGLPLVAIEASAAGLPIVATAVDGTPEVVLDGETGLLVPPEDPAALADAIVRLCGDKAMREEMGRRAKMWVRGEFAMDRQLKATERLYLALGEGLEDKRKHIWSSIT